MPPILRSVRIQWFYTSFDSSSFPGSKSSLFFTLVSNHGLRLFGVPRGVVRLHGQGVSDLLFVICWTHSLANAPDLYEIPNSIIIVI